MKTKGFILLLAAGLLLPAIGLAVDIKVKGGNIIPKYFDFTWEVASLPEKSGPASVRVTFAPLGGCIDADEYEVTLECSRGLQCIGPETIMVEGTGSDSYTVDFNVEVPEADTCCVSTYVLAGGCGQNVRVWFWPSDSGLQCGLNLPRAPKPPHPAEIERARMTEEELQVEYYVATPFQWLIPSQRKIIEQLLGPSSPPMGPDSLYQNRTTVDMLLRLEEHGVGFRDKRQVPPHR